MGFRARWRSGPRAWFGDSEVDPVQNAPAAVAPSDATTTVDDNGSPEENQVNVTAGLLAPLIAIEFNLEVGIEYELEFDTDQMDVVCTLLGDAILLHTFTLALVGGVYRSTLRFTAQTVAHTFRAGRVSGNYLIRGLRCRRRFR